MERLKIRYLALILLLSGCQMLEVTNDESIELIPDLSEPKNEETIESNQLVEEPCSVRRLSILVFLIIRSLFFGSTSTENSRLLFVYS